MTHKDALKTIEDNIEILFVGKDQRSANAYQKALATCQSIRNSVPEGLEKAIEADSLTNDDEIDKANDVHLEKYGRQTHHTNAEAARILLEITGEPNE